LTYPKTRGLCSRRLTLFVGRAAAVGPGAPAWNADGADERGFSRNTIDVNGARGQRWSRTQGDESTGYHAKRVETRFRKPVRRFNRSAGSTGFNRFGIADAGFNPRHRL